MDPFLWQHLVFKNLYKFLVCNFSQVLLLWVTTCEEFLHTFTIKICTHKKTGWKWNYYVVVVLTSKAVQGK
jgi:hypothetical protein